MKKKEDAGDPKEGLEKLVKLTKLMKMENVKVAPKGPPKGANKWRAQDPKFEPKTAKPENLVDGGGMQVDPSVKDEYDAWRKDKEREQADRIEALKRKAEAARLKRQSQPDY